MLVLLTCTKHVLAPGAVLAALLAVLHATVPVLHIMNHFRDDRTAAISKLLRSNKYKSKV